MVDLEPIDDEDGSFLFEVVSKHREETRSRVAKRLLDSWDAAVGEFVKVMPRDYRRVLEATKQAIAQGTSVDEAVMAAAHG
jgi:glutamate synthase (NADPH) large chain